MPVMALIGSLSFPVLGLMLSGSQFVIIELSHDNDEMQEFRNGWFLAFLIFCFVVSIYFGLETLVFGISGENLTANVRKLLFKGIIFKQVCWFDDEKKAPGVLTSVLSEDVACLNGMTTETLATVMEMALGLITGVALSCFFSWPIALMTIAISPLYVIGTFAMSRLQWKKTEFNITDVNDPYLKSNALLSDIILNYKTVISFGEKNIDALIKNYELLLKEPAAKRIRTSHIAGFFFGYSQAVRMIFTGIVFFLGTITVRKFGYDSPLVFVAIYILSITAYGAGA